MEPCAISDCVSTCKCLVIDLLATFYEQNVSQLMKMCQVIPSPSSWKLYLTHFNGTIRELNKPFKDQKVLPNLIIAYFDILKHTLHKLEKLGSVKRYDDIHLAIVETTKNDEDISKVLLETFYCENIQFVQTGPEQAMPIVYSYYMLLELEEENLFEARLELLEEIKNVELVEHTYDTVLENYMEYEDDSNEEEENDEEIDAIGWGNITGEPYTSFQKKKMNKQKWTTKRIEIKVDEETKNWSKITCILNQPQKTNTKEIEINPQTTKIKDLIFNNLNRNFKNLININANPFNYQPRCAKILEKILNLFQNKSNEIKEEDFQLDVQMKVANTVWRLEKMKLSAFKCFRRKMNGKLLKSIMKMIK